MSSSSAATVAASRTPPKWKSVSTLYSADWLRLQRISYVDRRGHDRTWDRYQRTTALTTDGTIPDSACALALTYIPGQEQKPKHIILVKQYRPSLDRYTIEFPAGLIDKGEDATTTAIRELKEETGLVGEVNGVSAQLAQTVLGTESTQLVVMKVDLSLAANQNPEPCEEDKEEIQTIRLPLDNMLQALYDHAASSDTLIFEGVHNLVVGMALSPARLVEGNDVFPH